MNTTFSGEMQLAGWSESHNGGCKVTFWLPSPDDLEAFRALTVRKGNTAGHRFMAALVEIDDEENPVEPPPNVPAAETRKGVGPLAWEAIQLCRNSEFQAWLTGDGFCGEAAVARMMRDLCGVQSRNEFDTDEKAGTRFIERIRIPFMRRHRA